MRKHLRRFAEKFWKQPYEKGFVSVHYGALLALALALLLLPPEWVFGWLVATAVHEVSHLIALKAVGVPVVRIRFGFLGAKIDTVPLSSAEELISAAAGPIGGLVIAAFTVNVPCICFCALSQSFFNLLPVYPMDGGRIFKLVCFYLFDDLRVKWICKIVNILVPMILTLLLLCFCGMKYI